ncbi:MAG: HDOD domain-containing protein [Nitrospirae bacterium]|nr:HDOD domain-containing protein [Nitrospirota bacterium]
MDKERQTILFVDDELSILNSLRRLLQDEAWDLRFAESGEKAIDVLKKEDVDLVISDVRMPGMDGITFLKQVRELYPHVVRIFLSGYADRGAIVQALSEGCAQQLVSKPWRDDELKGIIRDALLQAEELKQKGKGLQKIINSISTLRTMPQTYFEIKKCFSHINTVSIEHLAEIIEQDTSISAELLRWANSSLFGQRHKVDTVERALMVLGIDIVEGLVLSYSIFSPMSPGSQSDTGFDLKDFQTHSLSCGILAKMLAGRLPHLDDKEAERAFTAGLLHDMGKLVEEMCLADDFRKIMDTARLKKSLLIEAEYDILETNHEEIGRHLAEWWSMPSFLVNAIRWHHEPRLCKTNQDIVAAVHVSNVLVQKFELGSSGNFRVPEADPADLKHFGLTEEELPAIKESVIFYLS